MDIFYDLPEVFSRNIITIAYIVSFGSLLPQIILNYRIKSGRGISDLMLLGGMNGHCARLFYHFCARLPLVYRLVGPLSSVAFFVLVGQRFFYDRSPEGRRLLGFFTCNLLFFLLILPVGLSNKNAAGNFFGLITMPIWFMYQLPQLYKIHRSKSVEGFSIFSVLLTICSGFLELFAAFVLDLPMATIINDLRSILVSFLFFMQFKMYSQK